MVVFDPPPPTPPPPRVPSVVGRKPGATLPVVLRCELPVVVPRKIWLR